MKAIFTAACVLTCCLGNEMPAKAHHVHTTTVVQPQTEVCTHVPAHNAGFIRVGNQVEQINAPARVDCAWQNDAHRTIINTVTTY